MANICFNRLLFIGLTWDLVEVWNSLLGARDKDLCHGDEWVLDLQKVVPMPDGLYSPGYVTECDPEVLKAKYGTSDAREWRLENWGTTEGYCPVFSEKFGTEYEFGNRCHLELGIQSDWTPINGIVSAVSRRFPNVGIVNVFEEEGSDIRGLASFRGGKLLRETAFTADEIWETCDVPFEECDEDTEEFEEKVAKKFESLTVEFVAELEALVGSIDDDEPTDYENLYLEVCDEA